MEALYYICLALLCCGVIAGIYIYKFILFFIFTSIKCTNGKLLLGESFIEINVM